MINTDEGMKTDGGMTNTDVGTTNTNVAMTSMDLRTNTETGMTKKD